MDIEEIENIVIECLKENLEYSGEEIPTINKNTKPVSDINGFDSLRTVEMLVAAGEKLGLELSPKAFSGIKFEDADISTIATAINKAKQEANK